MSYLAPFTLPFNPPKKIGHGAVSGDLTDEVRFLVPDLV
jgi:hypothetical protein